MSRTISLQAALLLWLISSAPQSLAETPEITAISPAGGQQGRTIEVTVQGKLGTAPLRFWSNQPELTAMFPEKPEKTFSLTIPEQTSPGPVLLRLANADGASRLLPFVVGKLPEVQEAEPNEALEKSQTIATDGCVVNGALGKNGDVDTFAIDLEAGQTLVAAVTAQQILGSPMDGVLQLVASDGYVVAQNDDDHANDPLLIYVAKKAGRYYLRLFGFPATPNSSIRFSGGADWIYRLTVSTGPYVDHLQPVALHGPARSLFTNQSAGIFQSSPSRSRHLKTEKHSFTSIPCPRTLSHSRLRITRSYRNLSQSRSLPRVA